MKSGFIAFGSMILLTAMVLLGCSRPTWTTDRLAAQIAGADHAVATNEIVGSALVITGNQMSDLVRAISSATGLRKGQTAKTDPCCEIRFFRGTNLLSSIRVQEEWFGTGGDEFIEHSGVLTSLQRRLEK